MSIGGFRKRRAMTTSAYFIVADIIAKVEDAALRKAMADHFATEFNRRSPSFDPYQWERRTGGKCAPNSAYGSKTPEKAA